MSRSLVARTCAAVRDAGESDAAMWVAAVRRHGVSEHGARLIVAWLIQRAVDERQAREGLPS